MTLQELIQQVLSRSGPVTPHRVPGTETTVTSKITDARPPFPPLEDLRAIILGTRTAPPTGVVQRRWETAPEATATPDVQALLDQLRRDHPYAAKLPRRIVGMPGLREIKGANGRIMAENPDVVEIDPQGPHPYQTLLHELAHVGDIQNLGRGAMTDSEAGASEEKAYASRLKGDRQLGIYSDLLNWGSKGQFDPGHAYLTMADLVDRLWKERGGRP